ncbi:MAG: radical SAM protein [Candidatus Methanofastidiosia archaeon]
MQGCIEQHTSMAFDAPEQIEYFKRGKLYAVQIESEGSCMQGCIYCYAKASPNAKNHLTSEEIIKIIDDSKDLEVRMIDWLGGDPLMRSDWYELAKYALSKGFQTTSGPVAILLQT